MWKILIANGAALETSWTVQEMVSAIEALAHERLLSRVEASHLEQYIFALTNSEGEWIDNRFT